MQKLISVVLLSSLLGIAVFGMIAVQHDGAHSTCFVAITQNMECPENSAISFVIFHLKSFSSFSLGVLLSILLLGFFVMSADLKLKEFRFYIPKPKDKYALIINFLLHWLSLHTNSPTRIAAL